MEKTIAVVRRDMDIGAVQGNLLPPASRRRIIADVERARQTMPRESMRLNFDLVGLLLLLELISSSSLCAVGFEAGGVVNFSFNPVRSMEIQKKGA